MDTEYIPIGLSAVVLGFAYFNVAFSIQEFLKKDSRPLWKKVWRSIQNDTEDVCRILLLSWGLFPNISTLQSLRILWLVIIAEALHRRIKNKISFIQGGAEDIFRIVLMWLALYPNLSTLYDVWIVWVVVLMEFIYRKLKINIPYFKEFVSHLFSTLSSRILQSREDGSSNAEKKIIEELKCPVCYKFMSPPITMCTNGHNICNNCKPRLSSCPICITGELLPVRNLALENVCGSIQKKLD